MNQRQRAPRDRRSSVSLAVLVFVFAASFLQAQSEFIRGDANQDGSVSISDMVTSQRYMFVDGIELGCMDTLDFDDNGVLDITDNVEMLKGLFIYDDWGGPVPAPFPNPGIDPTPDVAIHLWSEITCESYEIVEGIVSQDSIRLGEVEARPGETVEVPIYLTKLHSGPGHAATDRVRLERASDRFRCGYTHLRGVVLREILREEVHLVQWQRLVQFSLPRRSTRVF